MSADGAYTITSFGYEIDSTYGTLPKLVLIDNTGGFTDATRINDTQFDLPTVSYSANAATGICFFFRADPWHWLGLSYLLWRSRQAREYPSGAVQLPR